MRAVIPYKKENAKSRLSSVMTKDERETFVELMLKDVIQTLTEAGVQNIDILTTDTGDVANDIGVRVIEDRADLNPALNSYLKGLNEPVLIIMADLPLVRSEHIQQITSSPSDVVIVPGKGGGTNMLFIRQPEGFHVKYYGSSFRNHCRIVNDLSMSMNVYDSFLASTDIDEPQDLIEVMLHGQGLSREYIRQRFRAEVGNGRVQLSTID
ncbi:MAG: 2-phospho-L-lactate guanylyltransferase [Euryarchaeota archaeon]|nr:2-phospho-L-lactate guanylyltransferase [Euryarchaeota archaeon]